MIRLAVIAIAFLGLLATTAWYRGEAIKHEALAREHAAATESLKGQAKRQAERHARDLERFREMNQQNARLATQVSAVRSAIARLPKEAGDARECQIRPAPIATERANRVFGMLHQPAGVEREAARAGAPEAPASGPAERGAGRMERGEDRGAGLVRSVLGRLPGAAAEPSRGRALQ